MNGVGPSDPDAMKKLIKGEDTEESSDDDDEELSNGVNGINGNKGKARASDENERMQEYIVCTLDRNTVCLYFQNYSYFNKTNIFFKAYQVPLDLTIRLDEECYFRNSGHTTIYLTGNFVISPPEEDDEEEDYDSDEEDDGLIQLANGGLEDELEYSGESEDDVLDGLVDPRVMEIDMDEEEAPELIKAAVKPTKKRAAETLDESPESILKAHVNGLTKEEKRQAKKQKKNDGQAVAAGATEEPKKGKKEAAASKKDDTPITNGKKVQFAEKLEQGPTPSKNGPPTKSTGPRKVNGVTVDDKKVGTGPTIKKGDRVGMRYIGKLKDGKQFDSNKKGKPFSFKVGVGEVIQGWDIGVQGMAVGGERRITIPSGLAYGSKKLPGIPPNSELTFDLKVISIN